MSIFDVENLEVRKVRIIPDMLYGSVAIANYG